jgi:hypothetical protein
MTYDLPMPKSSKHLGWKVKIRNLERTEDPHVTIIWKTLSWRYNIRNTGFMDREPNPDQVPKDVVAHIEENVEKLRAEWNKKHPENRVESRDR